LFYTLFEILMIKNIGPLLLLLATSSLCHSYTEPTLFDAEWAMIPKDQSATTVLRFYKDGMVENTVTSVTGKYQFLDDDRIMIEFDDGIMMGKFEKTDQGAELKGIAYSPNRRIDLEFSALTDEKKQAAEEFQDKLMGEITQARSANINKAILNNLATIAAAAQMYLLLEGKTEVELGDLVGPGKLIPQIQSIYGEGYEKLRVTFETRNLAVQDKDGKEHSYEF
jgi:hypothetical protein